MSCEIRPLGRKVFEIFTQGLGPFGKKTLVDLEKQCYSSPGAPRTGMGGSFGRAWRARLHELAGQVGPIDAEPAPNGSLTFHP